MLCPYAKQNSPYDDFLECRALPLFPHTYKVCYYSPDKPGSCELKEQVEEEQRILNRSW